MEKKEKKEFKLLKNDSLQIDVHGEDVLFIPSKEGNLQIGDFIQHTIQTVSKEKVDLLVDFIKQQKELTDGQLINLNKTLEQLKDISEYIPDDLRERIRKYLDKGANKQTKTNLNELNVQIQRIQQKKQSEQQRKFLLQQLETINEDWFKLQDALKKGK